MTLTYQDILSAICTSVTLINENETQSSFSVAPQREAQLAYDILAAHGFDVRVYHEDEYSKLYITRPAIISDNDVFEKKLHSSLQFAKTIHQLLDTMSGAQTDGEYQVNFANTPTLGKQISIYFPPAPAFANAQSTQKTSAAAPASQQHQPSARRRSSYATRKASQEDGVLTGPALAKQYPFGVKPPKTHEDSLGKWISTYVFSNFSESAYAFFGMAFLTLVILSLVVMIRGFMCPDLATVKSREWYCQIGVTQEEPKKSSTNRSYPQ